MSGNAEEQVMGPDNLEVTLPPHEQAKQEGNGEVANAADREEPRHQSKASSTSASSQPRPPLRRVGIRTKLVYAAPGLATLPFTFMFGMHGNQSYQAFGASISIIALSMALARSFDVLSDPLMSYWTDSAKCIFMPEWLRGRRRPFMFLGAFFYAGSLMLLTNPPYLSGTALSVYFGLSYTLFFLASTFVCIPYDALAAELSEDSNQRVGIFFVTSAFDSLGIMGAMSMPSLMTRFATKLHLNGDICRSNAETAQLCLQGRSCGNVLSGGLDKAFNFNSTLAGLLAPLQGQAELSQDPLRMCLAWTSGSLVDSVKVFGMDVTAEQTNGFCGCLIDCNDSCELADRRSGFGFVGAVFALWFLLAMLLAVCWLRERPAPPRELQDHKPAHLVPRLRGLFQNRPFCFLLPAWVMEAFGNALNGSLFIYFLECIVDPAHQTMELHGHDCAPSSPSFEGGIWVGEAGRHGGDWMCSMTDVTGILGWCQNFGLLCFMPLWPLLATKLGKVETWLLVSFLCMVMEVLKLFIQNGQVMFAMIVFGVATLPQGGKFLGEVIMTDIIDYDEFLTGTRNEATFFMFKSFIPKIILIPASAIPLALLRTFGYLEPQNGRTMSQPANVQWYIRSVCMFNIACQLVALVLKWNYPLRKKELEGLSKSLAEIRAGRAATDPITGRMHWPLCPASEEQGHVLSLLGHFPLRRLWRAFKESRLRDAKATKAASENPEGPVEEALAMEANPEEDLDAGTNRDALAKSTQKLVRIQRLNLLRDVGLLAAAVAGACGTLHYIFTNQFAWVPTLLVVCVGASCAAVLLSFKTLCAARALKRLARTQSLSFRLVDALIEHRAAVALLGHHSKRKALFC